MVSGELGIPQISTGDILREAVSRGTELGRQAKSYMDKGELVPDEVMLPLVEARIGESDCSGGYVLDGFPRTLAQAMGLEEILQRQGRTIDIVLFIDVSEDEILRRLSRRRVCPKCTALYNLDADPPRDTLVCDRCGVELVLRSDDTESTVKTRLRVYRQDTLPLVDYYESRGTLRRVDGNEKIDTVFSSILDEISGARRS
jgi:adenylate kinase